MPIINWATLTYWIYYVRAGIWYSMCLYTRDVQLGNFLSISISTNSIGLLSISTFINSTQAESYQYQLNLSCSNQLINSISTWIPKLLFFSQKLIFRAFLQRNSHQRFLVLLSQNQNFGDSRFKSCLGIILGIEVRAVKDSESVSKPKIGYSQS